jgi:hypothetical protein
VGGEPCSQPPMSATPDRAAGLTRVTWSLASMISTAGPSPSATGCPAREALVCVPAKRDLLDGPGDNLAACRQLVRACHGEGGVARAAVDRQGAPAGAAAVEDHAEFIGEAESGPEKVAVAAAGVQSAGSRWASQVTTTTRDSTEPAGCPLAGG